MRRLAPILLLVGAACAAPLEDAWGPAASVPARAVHAARPAAPSRLAPARHQDPEALAHDLEMTLLRFTARRRSLSRELGAGSSAWPEAMVAAWAEVLGTVEAGFSTVEGPLPGRLLVQTRVTLEAELELTERRHGPAPSDLGARVKAVYGHVARQMSARRARCAKGPGCAAAPSRLASPFVFPVAPVVVTSPFGFRRDPILGAKRVRFHAGVDLGGRRGDVVVAAAPGRVVSAGWHGGHGRTVTVQHPGGYVTRYAHLSRILVTLHSEVDAGSPVGLMGSTGRSTGPHLHFEVRRGSVPIDPLELLGRPAYATR